MSIDQPTQPRREVLIAGVGNVFWGDDGFGSEVARRLAAEPAIEGVTVRDFGVSAVDLFYCLERTDSAVIIDIVSRGGAPGTLYVLDPADEPGDEASPPHVNDASEPCAHALTAADVIRFTANRARAGAAPRQVRIVGCEPESFGEPEGRLGLSDTVSAALERAVVLAAEVARSLLGSG